MYFSLETRFPFLDHRLIEKTLATDAQKIINKGVNKQILRQATSGILQDEIRLRKDKVGYSTPEDNWFRTDKFKEFIGDILNSNYFMNRGYFDNKKIALLLSRHYDNRTNAGREIWKMIHLELWFRKYIDNA
jgi:asparagine synthase (glutamine-hydrolysing)